MSVNRPSLGQPCYMHLTQANFTSPSAAFPLPCWKSPCHPCGHKPSWWSGHLCAQDWELEVWIWPQGLGMWESLSCERHWSPSASAVRAHSFPPYLPFPSFHIHPFLSACHAASVECNTASDSDGPSELECVQHCQGKYRTQRRMRPFSPVFLTFHSPTWKGPAFSNKEYWAQGPFYIPTVEHNR